MKLEMTLFVQVRLLGILGVYIIVAFRHLQDLTLQPVLHEHLKKTLPSPMDCAVKLTSNFVYLFSSLKLLLIILIYLSWKHNTAHTCSACNNPLLFSVSFGCVLRNSVDQVSFLVLVWVATLFRFFHHATCTIPQ